LSSFESALGSVILRYLRFFQYRTSKANCKAFLINIIVKNITIINIAQVAKSLNNHQSLISNHVQSRLFHDFSSFLVGFFMFELLFVHSTQANVWLKSINNQAIIKTIFFIYLY